LLDCPQLFEIDCF